MTRRIEFTVADEIAAKYDEARGHEPLASWVKRALESALREPGAPDVRSDASTVRSPSASSRASDHRALAMQRQAKMNKAKAGKKA